MVFSILMASVRNLDLAHLEQDRMAALIARYEGWDLSTAYMAPQRSHVWWVVTKVWSVAAKTD